MGQSGDEGRRENPRTSCRQLENGHSGELNESTLPGKASKAWRQEPRAMWWTGEEGVVEKGK